MRDREHEEQLERLAARVPPLVRHSLKLYVEKRVPTGGFLKAVLTNDLFGAYMRADGQNVRAIQDIVYYIYNALPAESWGSEEKYQAWLADKGGA